VKRLLVLVALALAVAAGVTAVQRLDQERRYQRLLADGDRALSEGHGHQAIELFSGALALRPRSMVAFYRRGEAYASQALDDQAVRDLREAARISPTAPQPLEALGKLHDERGDPAQAAEWYRQAADRLRDANPELLYALALALYRSGAPAAAKEPLRLALSRRESPEARYLFGLVARDARNVALMRSMEVSRKGSCQPRVTEHQSLPIFANASLCPPRNARCCFPGRVRRCDDAGADAAQ
jgi:tetratricopeptide (TPR) repeat protein